MRWRKQKGALTAIANTNKQTIMAFTHRMSCSLCVARVFALRSRTEFAMLSKRQRPSDHAAIDARKRLRANLTDLMLCSEVSARRTKELAEDAQAAGAAHVADLAKSGASGPILWVWGVWGVWGRNLKRKPKQSTCAKKY